ncbi:Uncharacterised protein [Neisseria animaloris]|nr:Uncharacterised protein [Neisseria animaloris]
MRRPSEQAVSDGLLYLQAPMHGKPLRCGKTSFAEFI